MTTSAVRCRVAPSPSGFLHIGTAKTALYNWLFARSNGGTFILRLEDTDAERTEEQYVQAMCEGFKWLGIEWDEGPEFGDEPEKGAFGPYRQSQRLQLYSEEAARLVAEGKAYRCYCTKEELDAQREQAALEKRPPRYSGKCRNLTPEEIAAKGDTPYAIRFRVPEGETVIDDIIQGPVRIQNKEYDDFIIVKSNGDAIFHLAVVVDDGLMKITHVIRGDDHLTNAGRHVMLFNALGYPLPKFAHHPLIHDEQGRKYSKRLHGANVLDWRKDGYLPETMINYISLLGWTSEEEGREFYTLDELKQLFTLKRLTKSPARFDRKKLDWLNGQHIRMLSPDALCDRVLPILREQGFPVDERSRDWLVEMAAICQEKIPTLNHIIPYTDFFFAAPTAYDEKGDRKFFRQDTSLQALEAALECMRQADEWTVTALKESYEAAAEQKELKIGALVNGTRLALTGKTVGPGLYELVKLLGREESVQRMEAALNYIKTSGEGTA
ncbi:MAG TPA: glutamate--tRNA ligase [Candidatus Hydrogenedentes bacterium]|jgi:glutamyl-tRNA synthetase|nr:MAG: Glutamate--tRNA ligase [Candidatus Hydrogenedentes bacterium ADurb.Bin170]HNZ47680.1 glutamate--tRNA ligase [Candidatus Hydrogenedentota bacterium]HOD95508.1 glutamate--tRNA ligase [Candidatus Hydrogenedentota bacterium]HOM48918.1 glutamate--tRNA ligase [Candidatus Hydrogenedentota bacterium]HOR50963.1 glutamate--tRNA ligase [Candidatus Hydrogenedentota bacterium]